MRLFAATLATETNTFAPLPTGLPAFHETGYYPAGEHPPAMQLFSGPLVAARERARANGWTLFEGVTAFAQPGGITTRHAYETLRNELLADLERVLPVDVVLLGLHGAMVADGYDDCEGDLLQRVRERVGPEVIIGGELDPHCHLTPAMLSNANLLITFKEYPHTDAAERALELVDLCTRAALGEIRPVASVHDCNMIVVIHTPREPARSIVDDLHALEGKDGVLSVSIAHGFPWGDVPDMGTKVLVYTDGAPEAGAALAQSIGERLWAVRETLGPSFLGIDAALDACRGNEAPNQGPDAGPNERPTEGPTEGPIVLADSADNAGGGAPGDSTFLLRRLIERGFTSVALGPLWDSVAVRMCFEAGEGARLPLRVGGKIAPVSGDPVDLQVTVKALRADMVMTGLGGTPAAMGDSALIEADGIEIVLASIRGQGFDTDLFTQLGCTLHDKHIVVVKSSQHFYASFSRVASRVIYVAAPGAVTSDLRALPYRNIRRPKWPLD